MLQFITLDKENYKAFLKSVADKYESFLFIYNKITKGEVSHNIIMDVLYMYDRIVYDVTFEEYLEYYRDFTIKMIALRLKNIFDMIGTED